MASLFVRYLSYFVIIITDLKVLTGVFIISQVCSLIGVTTTSFSSRWVVTRCDESRFHQCEAHLGLFESCVVYTNLDPNGGDEFECSMCKRDPGDKEFYTGKTDVDSLTTCKAFAGLTLTLNLVLFLTSTVYILASWLDWNKRVQKLSYVLSLLASVGQVLTYAIQACIATWFFRNVSEIKVNSHIHAVEALSFGWPRVVCWFVLLVLILPALILMYLFCKLVRQTSQ
ncbi:uncharacterized protein LOC134855587 [Symsagittifera roscoffensis]|uniref:uncharacterized protein LOC134855587 n=1 Tax=Symsagittifera roscoffensis TaxID=84072 RepID=UPI00307C914F